MDFEDQALVKLEWSSHRRKPSSKDALVPLLHRPFGDLEHKMEGQCHIGFNKQRQLGVPAGCSQLWWCFADELTDKLSLNEPLVKTFVGSHCTISNTAVGTGTWSGVQPTKDVCRN